MPLDLTALTALGDLAAPDEPVARRRLPDLPSLARMPELAALADLRPDISRRRLAALVAAAALAGAVCGLLAPATSALAAPLTTALSGALHPALPDRPDPRPVPVAGPTTPSAQGVDDAATPDPAPVPDRPSVSAVDAATGALRSGLGLG